MLRWSGSLVLMLGLFLTACGSDDDDSDDGDAGSISISCSTGQFKAKGELDGAAIDITKTGFTWNGGFQSGLMYPDGVGKFHMNTTDSGEPGTGAEGKLQLYVTFKDGTSADGTVLDAKGWVDLTPDAGPKVGNCETGASPSLFALAGERGAKFKFASLNKAPHCTGTPVTGSIEVCVGD